MTIDKDWPEKLKAIQKAEYEYCKDHLIYFVESYCVIEDKDAPDVIVPFDPWPEQKRVLREIKHNRLNLILKARQMGITWISLYYCIWDLLFNQGHTVIALSKTEEDAKELVRRVSVVLENMPEMFSAGGQTWEKTATSVSIKKEGKPDSVFRAFPSSPSAGRSFTANILLLDEWAFQEWAEEIYTSAYPTINRPNGGKVIGLSTIKRGTLFEKLWTEDNAFHKIFLSVFADPRRTKEWYERTAIDLGAKIKQEYPRTAEEALSNIGGAFFPEFDYDLHTCDPFPIPSDWSIYNTMDYGLDMFAHYKIAIDNEGTCYVFHEIYQSGLIISDAASRVKTAEIDEDGNEWYMPRERLAPPDMWNRSQESGKSRALVFEENGLTLTRSNNDREAGWMAVKELLKERTAPDGTKFARLVIFRTCVNLIRTIPQILIDEKNVNDCAKEPHELTHAPDALRYFAIYWTVPSEKKEPEGVPYSDSVYEDWINADAETKKVIEKMMGGKPSNDY